MNVARHSVNIQQEKKNKMWKNKILKKKFQLFFKCFMFDCFTTWFTAWNSFLVFFIVHPVVVLFAILFFFAHCFFISFLVFVCHLENLLSLCEHKVKWKKKGTEMPNIQKAKWPLIWIQRNQYELNGWPVCVRFMFLFYFWFHCNT